MQMTIIATWEQKRGVQVDFYYSSLILTLRKNTKNDSMLIRKTGNIILWFRISRYVPKVEKLILWSTFWNALLQWKSITQNKGWEMPIIRRKIYDGKHLRYVGGFHGGNNHTIDIIYIVAKVFGRLIL